jgi:hypothetical protein
MRTACIESDSAPKGPALVTSEAPGAVQPSACENVQPKLLELRDGHDALLVDVLSSVTALHYM